MQSNRIRSAQNLNPSLRVNNNLHVNDNLQTPINGNTRVIKLNQTNKNNNTPLM